MLFVDTGPLLARYHGGDQYHSEAVRLWHKVQRENQICLTNNFVLNETFTLLGRRMGYGFAAERARNIYFSERLTIIRSTHEDEWEAIQLFEKYADQKISFTDCISFVLMRKKKLIDVLSFDQHFERAGFRLWT
jgi:uncharacterized protein